ncbi:MAG: hypothetical protein RQ824_11715 [bacterium]|nr:hypothetical protein [bacterium]
MTIFIPLALIIVFIIVLIQAIYQVRHNKILRDVANKIEGQNGAQRLVLNSFLDKLNKMDMYREAIINVETPEVRKLFEELSDEEDKHLKLLKKALL